MGSAWRNSDYSSGGPAGQPTRPQTNPTLIFIIIALFMVAIKSHLCLGKKEEKFIHFIRFKRSNQICKNTLHISGIPPLSMILLFLNKSSFQLLLCVQCTEKEILSRYYRLHLVTDMGNISRHPSKQCKHLYFHLFSSSF